MEMARESLSYRELAERLTAVGLEENERNIANKVARGELSAATFLLCLKVMGTTRLNLDLVPLSAEVAGEQLTIGQVLKEESVKIILRDDEAGIYKVNVGFPTPVTILLERLSEKGGTKYTLSHAMVAPGHSTPQHVTQFGETPARALRRALRDLTVPFRRAFEDGHSPEASWLVPFDTLPKHEYDEVGRLIETNEE